ncbi:MAG: hypothetical protein JWP35_3626 [Caulobacter sp.]|nr:hypothetical protein [Caulobacter sp.]
MAPDPNTPKAYAALCRRDLPKGHRHTQLYADAARRRHLTTLPHECAEGEAVILAGGVERLVTWRVIA